MKFALTTALGIALAASFPALAQTYQWKDSSGRTIISDTPPPASAKGTRSIGSEQPAATTEKPADRELDYKKRQQADKTKAEQKAKEEAKAHERAEQCEQIRRNVAALESDRHLTTLGADGSPEYLDADRRQQELDRAYRQIQESCN